MRNRSSTYLLPLLLLSMGLQAQEKAGLVIASTSWTAAIARAGGARNILVLAPSDMRHPAEYEPKPTDMLKLGTARLVVYGGYEKFAQRIVEASDQATTPALKLYTDNLPHILIAESAKVAELLGPEEIAGQKKWAESFMIYTTAFRARLMAAWPKKRVAVQGYLKTWAEWAGFEVVGVFGPGEASPAQLLAIAKEKPDLVIDNYHNPSGAALAESLKRPYALLINFPGLGGSVSIEDVYAYNEKVLLKAAAAQ